jgi:Ala-tRNA(Pro) deacylase
MIPSDIVKYVMDHRTPFARHWHPRAVGAQELAATIHVSGYRVAKSVIIDADGSKCIAVLPAAEMLDETRAALALGKRTARLVSESELERLFSSCELGAEPPFGGLYGLPVVADEKLADFDSVVFRAGSHEETIEMKWDDFVDLENPVIAPIGVPIASRRQATSEAPTIADNI